MSKYAEKLAAMSDAEFVDEAESKIWLSAFAANNSKSKYHDECDATWAEARRRGKMWLYQQGWNRAYQSAGYMPSEGDIRAASEPEPGASA